MIHVPMIASSDQSSFYLNNQQHSNSSNNNKSTRAIIHSEHDIKSREKINTIFNTTGNSSKRSAPPPPAFPTSDEFNFKLTLPVSSSSSNFNTIKSTSSQRSNGMIKHS